LVHLSAVVTVVVMTSGRPPSSGPARMLAYPTSRRLCERGRRSGSQARRRPRGERWYENFRSRRPIAQGLVWADGIVVTPPALDHDLSLLQRIEDLPVQEFVAQARVEALDVTVLPWAAGGDVGRLGTNGGNPLPYGLGDELGAVVRPDVRRHSARDEQVGQHVDHVDGLQLARHPDCQALVRELVEDVEHAILPSVVRAILHEVVGPHVIAILGPQADARSVRQPQTAAFRLLLGDLQPFTPPNPLDPLVVHKPAGVA